MVVLFWLSLSLLAYTYAGYFVLMSLLGLRRRQLDRPHMAAVEPFVSMVISLHNEERLIAERIANFEALEYPADKLELLLGDDCSTDRTRALIRERMASNPRIRLVEFESHQGKTAVINQLVPQARGEVIAFSDANTFWRPDALRLLTRHFADERVGVAAGRLVLRSATDVNIDDNYWQYETLLKKREGDFGVVLGAPGGIYVLRKALFRPLKSDVIQIDDFIWPVSVYWQGYIGANEPAAVAEEEAAPYVEAEFRRKVRIGTGDFRALWECRRLLAPWHGWVSFSFWSHKVLRWCAPFLLIAVLISNVLLLDRPLYRWLFYVQAAFYALGTLGFAVSRKKHIIGTICRVPYYFLGSNAALLVGFWKCVTGRQRAAWSQKAHRTA